jgi:hypothetical protein
VITTRLFIENFNKHDLTSAEKLSMLRGQISMLSRRCQEDIPLGLDSLIRAEKVARSLKLHEVAG